MIMDDGRGKIYQAFVDLLAEHTWDEVTLVVIAEKAGVKLSEVRESFDGKIGMIKHFSQMVDTQVLDQIDDDVAEEIARERLMDILLTRFDVLMPHKQMVRALFTAARADISLAAQLNCVALVSMTWMLNGAKINTSGVEGAMRVQGTTLVFAKVLKIWLDDDESMARTMASLDKELRRGERTMRRLDRVTSFLEPFKRMGKRRARPADDVEEMGI